MFANRDRAVWIVENMRKQSVAYRFVVYAYCVMPDHVHMLLIGLDSASNLLGFMRNFKQATAHDYLQHFHGTLWQKKFYDHILRHRDSSIAVAGYIWMNPVRKGLCEDAREYP